MDNVLLSSESTEWLTPAWLPEALGTFDLDPCEHPQHRRRLAADGYALPEEDGLDLPWDGKVWLNPPYGKDIKKWVSRMAEHGNGILLAPARTDTAWFNTIWHHASGVLFLRSRVRFEKPDGTLGGSPAFPSILASFGWGCLADLGNAHQYEPLEGKLVILK